MIIPSIDLSGGRAVQLRQGRDKVLELDDPIALAREFARYGPVAVVDLDAATGEGSNEATVKALCASAECRAGGGIRSVKRAAEVVGWGAEQIVVGTRAFAGGRADTAFLRKLAAALGRERVIVALDARNGRIVTEAWRREAGLDIFSALREVEPWAGEILYTCVEREGMMGGTDRETAAGLARESGLRVTVAGGIASTREIADLSRLGVDVQLGMALYTGVFGAAEAFVASIDWSKGLIPTVVRDVSGSVLMLAWSNAESLERTFMTGEGWYYSRSRQSLWHKGATSGHTQNLVSVRTDCDGDALLFTVRQKGAACHTGSWSCFGGKPFGLDDLRGVIRDRLDTAPPESYTASLDAAALKEKLIEEAGELAEARGPADVAWEAADLLYFLAVALEKAGVGTDAVFRELRRRRLAPRRRREP